MRHPLRALSLGIALALTPACASQIQDAARFENPFAAAHTIEQRAFALLHVYAAVVEEAGDVVRDPAAPAALRRALGQAERAATPAAETLHAAIVAYIRARGDFEASANSGQPAIERAAHALAIAARRLNEALVSAERPINELQALLRARGR